MTDGLGNSPVQKIDDNDPGDETQRNFRYQHAYGVILLIACLVKKQPYQAIWCEQHEDFLAELTSEEFDAIQVKTKRPENGDWELTDDAIEKTLSRFVGLYINFNEKIKNYMIVSNAEFMTCVLDIQDQKKLGRSPVRFIEAIKKALDISNITEPFKTTFDALAKKIGCTDDQLYYVLCRVHLVKGPERESFDAIIAHEHLPIIPECNGFSPSRLNGLRDELIQKVYAASSLQVDNPLRHLFVPDSEVSPIVSAKRIPVSVVIECINQPEDIVFRYQFVNSSLNLGHPHNHEGVLEEKFNKAGLQNQYQTMERRTLSTEQRLIELAYKEPDNFPTILGQVESIVKGECDEAELECRTNRVSDLAIYGEAMLNNVLLRLKVIAEKKPESVFNEPYESLVGTAGLLTENCSVWWGEKFELQGKKQ